MNPTAQHSTAQHSTAQHSTAQHSTAQHSTAVSIRRLSKVATYLSLFSTIFLPFYSHAETISHLGTAIGTNSVAVGQDSLATSTSGVANGHGAIATGGNLTKDQLNEKKQQYDRTLAEINKQNTTIIEKEKAIAAKGTEIEITDAALNHYKALVAPIEAKRQNLKNLNDQKNDKQNELNTKTETAADLNNQVNPFRKNGSEDQYIDFFDLLVNLDWGSQKPDAELAQDLKTNVDSKFGAAFSTYDVSKYVEIVKLYKRREGQISGSRQRFNNEMSNLPSNNGTVSSGNASGTNWASLAFSTDSIHSNIANLIDSYYNNPLNNNNYIDEYTYTLPIFIREYYHYSDDATINYLEKAGLLDYSDRSDYYKRLSPEMRNTIVLQAHSISKALKEQVFNALFTKAEVEPSNNTGRFGLTDRYLGRNFTGNSDSDKQQTGNLPKIFIQKYNKAHFDNYSLAKQVRFAFKKKESDTDKVAPLGYDGIIPVLNKLIGTGTEISSFLDSNDISRFKETYKYLKTYKDAIDWNFADSAIDLKDYKPKLEKAEAYYDKMNRIINLYEEIITERQQAGGGNQDLLDQKSRELIRLKSEVINGMDDMSNFLAGIELKYTPKAREYLEYGKAEADKMISELNNELRLYDPNQGLIRGVNDKITELVNNYKEAEKAKTEAETALNNLNEEIARSALTAEEKQNAQNIEAKEREKQAKEAEKQRLEEEKRAAEEALKRAREELTNSAFANLGQNSYAQGKDAFASGNDSIAIGTSSISTGTDAVAIGHQSQALATSAVALGKSAQVVAAANKGVAIGESAVVKHENSVAIGAGSTTVRGAQAGPYNAPIGGGLTASFATGSIGEFSVGADGKLRQITHVAAGSEDTDAVNVWQLKSAIDGLKTALVQNPPTTGDAGGAAGGTTINSKIKYVNVNGATAQPHKPASERTDGDSSATGAYTVAIGYLADATVDNSVALGDNAETTAAKTENSAGTTTYNNAEVIDNLNKKINQFAGANATGVVSVGKKGAEKRVQNVAAGLVSEKSTDAVNGSQLYALANAVQLGQTGLVQQGNAAENIQNGVNHNVLTVGAATGGQEVNFTNGQGANRRLSGVAEGINTYDAVNKGQLDKAISGVNNQIVQTEKRLKGGIANAIAMATLTQASQASQNMLSVGTGYYRGASSVAVGLSQVSDNGRVTFKVNGSVSQQGDVAAGAAIGFAW